MSMFGLVGHDAKVVIFPGSRVEDQRDHRGRTSRCDPDCLGWRDWRHVAEQSWDHEKPHFDTGNEYSDDFFVDVDYGIHDGFMGGGFAESSIRRSRFLRNTKAGVALGNFNALDIWIWDSLF